MICEIEKKQKRLQEVGMNLKAKYSGIDIVIDKIIEQIEVWYIFDDVVYKPTVICLWGMTSIGKSSLVRDLVKELGYFEKYCEVDVSRKSHESDTSIRGTRSMSYYYSRNSDRTISGQLSNLMDSNDDKMVLLVDELPKIHSSTNYGGSYDDIWNLLSDGRLGSGNMIISRYDSVIEKLENIINNYEIEQERKRYIKENPADKDDAGYNGYEMYQNSSNPYTIPLSATGMSIVNEVKLLLPNIMIDDFKPLFDYQNFAQGIKFNYGICVDIDIRREIENGSKTVKDIWDIPGFIFLVPLIAIVKNAKKKLLDSFNDVTSKDPMVLSKLLVFIAGNLDGLYTANSDAAIDADELFKITSNITHEQLKVELLNKFAPEEVSRFGGNHIIYPSLDRKAFERIIVENLKLVEVDTFKTTGVFVILNTDKFVKYIYDRGVVASQGTRPLISRLHGEISAILPKMIKTAKLNKLDKLNVDTFI